MYRILAAAIVLASIGTACGGSGKSEPTVKQWPAPPEMQIDVTKNYTATLTTSDGAIQVQLLAKEAPNTVNNFVFLARQGFYDGVKFHRIIKAFMLQTGDPTGTGRGGPGYNIVDEPVVGDYERGALAMANVGRPNTGGSQFFIVQGDNVFLPKTYTIFGKVALGMDVVDKLASVPVGATPQGEMSVPLQEVRIDRVTIQES